MGCFHQPGGSKSLEHTHKAFASAPTFSTFLFFFFPSRYILHLTLFSSFLRFFVSSFLRFLVHSSLGDSLPWIKYFASYSFIPFSCPGFPPSILDLVLFTLPY
ncbi:hypothetical protein BDV36DRAFT_251461 [Aspergillus pseudocaelatus]|uniref:Uncharacterized protein n=1 Tax=Aspergillus pseudocaelatus TaxID=1825620 RepID=A0ABQ6WS09_9EURO|nr:hypothetical protein BDV36DRAFT_251461 [Aspergillus pseudocaelatus]